MYEYRAKVLRVVDGDTIDLEWWDFGAGIKMHAAGDQQLRMRLAHINAYETSLRYGTTPEQKTLGIEAREWLKEQCEGQVVRLRTVKGGARGSFGRYLVWIWPDGDDDDPLLNATSYNQAILDYGWGVVYQ